MKELNTREMLSLRGGAHVVSNGLNQANRAVTIAGNRATSFMTHLETRGIHANWDIEYRFSTRRLAHGDRAGTPNHRYSLIGGKPLAKQD